VRGALLVALSTAIVAAQDEPTKRLLDDDPLVRAAAAEEIGKLGPAAASAVPRLVDLVHDEADAPSKAAIRALGRIGPAAREARPYLVDRGIGRADFEPVIAQALFRIGPPDPEPPLLIWLRAKGAVPATPCTLEDLSKNESKALRFVLLEALRNEQAIVAAQAARLLGPAARTDKNVVAALARLLDHPASCVRVHAGAALSHSPLAEGVFAPMLEDPDVKRRRVAARFYRGPGAVPRLRRALKDPDANVRRWAVGGFSSVDVQADPGLVVELAALLDSDPLLCASLATLVATLGAHAAPAVPAFARCCTSADRDVRWSACFALGRIGEHAAPAATSLAIASYDERQEVAVSALGALATLGRAARDAAPYLAELAEADLLLGPQARHALTAIGEGVPLPPLPDPAELPALRVALADPDGRTAGQAAFALGRLAAKDPETLEALAAALAHPSPYARKHAALALQRIGPASLPLIARAAGGAADPARLLAAATLIHFAGVAPDDVAPIARNLLASDDRFVQREAIRSLGVAGSPGRAAVPALIALLAHGDEEIVQVTIWALGRMRSDATGAVPHLVAILETSGDSTAVWAAILALGEIGVPAEPSIPSILAAARRSKSGVELFSPAVEALAKIGPAGHAALVQVIREETGARRQLAIGALARLNLNPPGFKEALEEVVKDGDVQTREMALMTIRQLAPESKPSLESLITALKKGPPDPQARAQIVYGLAEAAPVAELAAMAHGKDANLRLAALEALALKPRTAFTAADRASVRPILLDALESGDRALETAAAGALPNAPPTSLDPRILRLLGRKGSARRPIVQALVALGPEIVPKLAAALQGDGRDLRDGAAIALAGFGPEARAAIPALVEAALDDPAAAGEFARAILATKDLEACATLFADPRMPERQRFGEALAAAGVDALPHFDRLRRHADPTVRRESVQLLGRLGDKTVPWLLEAAEDKDPAVASAALRSLGRAVRPELAIPVLVRAIGDDALRDAAVKALRSHGAAARDALDALAADPRPRVRAAALPLLAALDESAVASVVGAMTDPDPAVRAAAAGALGMLGATAAPALPGLRALLEDPDSPVRLAAATALGRLGTNAEVAVPDLLDLMRRGDAHDRAAAGRALVSIGPATAPALGSLLSQPDQAVRNAARQALAELGEPAVPAIIALMASDDETRREAAATLARIGAPAAQALADRLKDKDRGVRRDAAWGLGSMGAEARRAVPDLITTLRDTDSQVVAQAAWALGQIGPAALDALPALRKLYEARRHRGIVADAIRKIRGGS